MARVELSVNLNRVEGDLEIALALEDGVVTEARTVGTLYRGFEQILHGRDVLHEPAEIDVALDLADDRGRAAIAGGIGGADAGLQVFGAGAVHCSQHMLALDLGQRGGPGVLAHPQLDALAIVFGQHRLVAAEGIGQGMTRRHGTQCCGVRVTRRCVPRTSVT